MIIKPIYEAGTGIYEAGTVEVAGACEEPEPVTEPGKVKCHYVVTFTGALTDQPVDVLRTEKSSEVSFAGTATVTEKAKGRPDGEIVVKAENVGDAATSANVPVSISDVVPAGFEAIGISGARPVGGNPEAMPCKLETLSCEWTSELPPFAELEVRVAVLAKSKLPSCEGDLASCELGRVTVSGGEAATASLARPLVTGERPAPFGLADYELLNEQQGGAPVTQAGEHPFQQTNVVDLNQGADTDPLTIAKPQVLPAGGLAKDLRFNWPAGLIGNPSAFPQCSEIDFLTQAPVKRQENLCPAGTAVGVVTFDIDEPRDFAFLTDTVPLFNLEPHRGEPARLGFYEPTANVATYIDAHVRSGRDYGVTVSSTNITETIAFLSAHVTVWGTPGDPRHDASRGWACLYASGARASEGEPRPCSRLAEPQPPAFLSMPTSCPRNPVTHAPEPLQSTVEGDSWTHPGTLEPLATYAMPATDGCNQLPFEPQVRVTPDVTAASTPTGLNVDVHLPQAETLNGEGLAISAPRDITVALPPGVAVNPSSGDGLAACSEGLAGFEGFQELAPGFSPATFKGYLPGSVAAREAGDFETLLQGTNVCPDAAKVATATIRTPILPHPVEGAVYLATQNQNPFGSLIAMYIVAEDPISGVLIKLAGNVSVCKAAGETIDGMSCAAPGQLITTFENSPQAPFEDAELHFFGGERAPLATPAHCGAYTTMASFTPWSGNAPVVSSSTFNITSGPGGGPCPGAQLPFSPSLTGGTSNINAGGFSPLTTTISRADGQQDLQSVRLHMPAGLEGLLSNVKLCPEAQANEGTCGPESQIGETTVSAGVGNDPVSVKGGRVYITEKYAGAPFGLSIVNPVKAGPFDLEHDTSNPAQDPPCDCVVVRARIEVDPVTAELTITTDESGPHAIPHLIDGIPVQIKAVNVLINREKFTFNPTSCNPTSLTGLIASDEGASSPVSVPFQPTNCAVLKYTPTLAVSTAAKASKVNGASLHFKIAYPKGAMGSQSWMKEMKFDIPRQLPARLTTIQKACLAHVFETERQNCPPASIIGHVLVHTPVLPVPLEGPLYFVSYGGAAFPDAVAVIKGYGITIESHGKTFINGKTGVTSATFESVPDVPFESIEVTVPQGKYSEFGANLPKGGLNFCGQKLTMPILFKAQNGAEIHQETPVSVTGCPPSVSITKAKVKGNSIAVTVKVAEKGTVKITGKGLKTTTKRGVKAGTHTITVPLTATGRAAKRHGRKLKIKAALTVAHRTGTATTTLRA